MMRVRGRSRSRSDSHALVNPSLFFKKEIGMEGETKERTLDGGHFFFAFFATGVNGASRAMKTNCSPLQRRSASEAPLAWDPSTGRDSAPFQGVRTVVCQGHLL